MDCLKNLFLNSIFLINSIYPNYDTKRKKNNEPIFIKVKKIVICRQY